MVGVSDIFAGLALVVSGVTCWLSFVRRGTVEMTQPSFVFLGPDGPDFDGPPKISTCFHLYCTADRGRIVEGMYVRLSRGDEQNDFDVWVYGSDGLARASGVYVGREGVTCSHHFLLPRPETSLSFLAGRYTVEIFGSIVGNREQKQLFRANLDLTTDAATAVNDRSAGVFFEWRPTARRYEARIDSAKERAERQMRKLPAILTELSRGTRSA